METVIQLNSGAKLSPHFTLGELTKSSHKEVYNIPSHEAIGNLKRVCGWLEVLRKRYNERILPLSRGRQRGSEQDADSPADQNSHSPLDQTTPGPSYSGGELPIIINSGYRSPQLNKKIGGVPSSNHLTGCAADIRVSGMGQALRYAVILLDYADESHQDFDELLIERNRYGAIWLHFAVRPKDNRRKINFINA